MSLALFRERIEAGDVDATARAHLRGCDECRAHYDTLALAARALGDDGAAAERERLFQALPAAETTKRPATLRWLVAVAALLLAVIATLVLRPREADVTFRGGAEGESAPFSLRVYGKDAPGQPVRLIADFPGSKEATVSLRAELQYFVKPGSKALLVETRSAQKTATSRNEAGAEELAPIGKAFPVGGFGPGNLEVCAALSPPGTSTLEEAVKAGATKYCSTLVVTP